MPHNILSLSRRLAATLRELSDAGDALLCGCGPYFICVDCALSYPERGEFDELEPVLSERLA